jgi:hypothetical protein
MEPVCIICFHARFSPKQPTLFLYSLNEALQTVYLRISEIECVFVNGEVFQYRQKFSNKEEYTHHLESFQDPRTRKIFYLVVGPYHRQTHSKQIRKLQKKDECKSHNNKK